MQILLLQETQDLFGRERVAVFGQVPDVARKKNVFFGMLPE